MKKKRLPYKLAMYILLLIVTVVVAFPFIWMIFSSFKDIKEFYYIPPTFAYV